MVAEAAAEKVVFKVVAAEAVVEVAAEALVEGPGAAVLVAEVAAEVPGVAVRLGVNPEAAVDRSCLLPLRLLKRHPRIVPVTCKATNLCCFCLVYTCVTPFSVKPCCKMLLSSNGDVRAVRYECSVMYTGRELDVAGAVSELRANGCAVQ